MKKNKYHKIYEKNGDDSSEKFERTFSGPMNPLRMEKLQQIAKQNTWREGCGHEFDCCGCQFEQQMKVSYKQGQVVVVITKLYNY